MTKQEPAAETLQLNQPWALASQDVLDALDVAAEEGLASAQVKRRRDAVGPNQLRSAQRHSAWQILLNQFKSLIVAFLLVAAALSFAFNQTVEGLAVIAVIAINAATCRPFNQPGGKRWNLKTPIRTPHAVRSIPSI